MVVSKVLGLLSKWICIICWMSWIWVSPLCFSWRRCRILYAFADVPQWVINWVSNTCIWECIYPRIMWSFPLQVCCPAGRTWGSGHLSSSRGYLLSWMVCSDDISLHDQSSQCLHSGIEADGLARIVHQLCSSHMVKLQMKRQTRSETILICQLWWKGAIVMPSCWGTACVLLTLLTCTSLLACTFPLPRLSTPVSWTLISPFLAVDNDILQLSNRCHCWSI